MNLYSASYVSRCGKPPRSWSNSIDKVPLQVARNCGYKNPSSEFKSADMASVYSDAEDTFASRPSNATSWTSNAAYEDHHNVVTAGPYSNTQGCARDSDSKDFILKRFLPAAQAMAATRVKSSTSTSAQRLENRLQKSSSDISSARLGSSASNLSKIKRQFTHEVKQDVRGDEFIDQSEPEIKACGFPLHLGRLTLQHFRYSFWTSRSSSRSKSQQSLTAVSQKVIMEEPSDDSDDLFWSDEERLSDAVSHAAMSSAVRSNERRDSNVSSEVRKRIEAEMLVRPIRFHSMETVHTPDHRGFLGLPKTTKSTYAETERTRQVDRLGARLTRMISKTNYMESRNGTRIIEHDETEAGIFSQGPSTTSTSSSSLEAPRTHSTQWVDTVTSMLPPPSPMMPSQSWLSNTLPPEKYMEMKKLSRKSLGSFIPIKPPRKPMPTERQLVNPEAVSIRLQQSCSLKEHFRGRYEDDV